MARLQSVHDVLEADALHASSAVFIYDTTPSAAFGEALTKAKTLDSDAEVWQMQTRPGAGASLVGFIESLAFSSKGTYASEVEGVEVTATKVPSKRPTRSEPIATKKSKTATVTASDKIVSVLSSTSSFLSLVPSILSLPTQGVRPAIAFQVSAQASSLVADADGNHSLTQVPDLASLFDAVQSLEEGEWNGAVVFSETATEAAFSGTGLAKAVTAAGFDFVNVFDGLTAGRQLSTITSSSVAPVAGAFGLEKILLSANGPFFSYYGDSSAATVFVLPASTYSASAKAALAVLNNKHVGIITVRVLKPWNTDMFLAALPSTTKSLCVLSEGGSEGRNDHFYRSVLTTLLTPSGGFKLKIRPLPISSSYTPSVHDWAQKIVDVSGSGGHLPGSFKSLLPEQAKLAVFWDLDATKGKTESVPFTLAKAFSQGNSDTGVAAQLEVKYDNYRQGGLQQSALLLEPKEKVTGDFTVGAIAEVSHPSLLFISSPTPVFKSYEPLSLSTLGPDSRVVISANWTAEEIPSKLPLSARKALAMVAVGEPNLFVIDTDKIASENKVSTAVVAELAFWSLYLPNTLPAKEMVSLLSTSATFASWEHDKVVELSAIVRKGLINIEINASFGDDSMEVDGAVEEAILPSALIATAAGPNLNRTFAEPEAVIAGTSPKHSWHQAAHRLLFPEAFDLETVLEEKMRPDLPEQNFLVTVTENRRLTPNTYDRNVFHLEFSTAGTGLKYSIGEALGIHGWNDEDEVRHFLEWYGLDPEAVLSIPSRSDPTGRVEQRTIFQIFQQNLDIFGKPGKSFYETLSRYASNKNQERALRFIACPDGHATFKKMSEMDTVTYADVLMQFPSARPPIEDLVREIEEIKPRHYSIASSQNFVGDSVHLLVVTVEWENPRGSPRYGQCTRYLAGLKVGQKVMVSVKPSVMKLPPLDTQPIIMAGLGTGAAPFRAFIQERAWQKAQGREVGPALYYFGSRHRSKEYLYGEEIEAYVNEGVVTHTGLAFSRDTNKKVYIQHKMNEDAELLARMLDDGAFYLCGPTWPVPDVYEALVKSFVGDGKSKEEAEARIEELKEQERYVLEVY